MYMQATTRIPNFYISTNGSPTHPDAMTPTGSLRRIVLHEPGIIAVPLAAAAGRRIHIDVWYNNSSENTKRLGFRVETLSIQIAGLGHYSVSHIVNVSSGGFDLQWMGSTGFDSDIPQQTAADLRKLYAEKRYDDTEKILRFEDHEKADQEAA
jgi:hypothetical protein